MIRNLVAGAADTERAKERIRKMMNVGGLIVYFVGLNDICESNHHNLDECVQSSDWSRCVWGS